MGAISTTCCRSMVSDPLFGAERQLEPKLIDDEKIVFGQRSASSNSASAASAVPKEYTITVKKTSDQRLGIDVNYVAESDSLPVRAITAGLIRDWNATHPECQVAVNDHIVEVNGERKVVDLLMDRLKSDTSLKITFVTAGPQLSAVCHLGPHGKPCNAGTNGSESPEKGTAVTGTVKLIKINDNTCRIEYEINGLSPGKHGFHIHEKADFSDGCVSAGPHYNPHGKLHGGPDAEQRHVGDLGNVEADMSGTARGVINDRLVKLDGLCSVVGRSIMVHADPDDLGTGDSSQPGPPPVNGKCSNITGNAGARLACGEIKLTA